MRLRHLAAVLWLAALWGGCIANPTPHPEHDGGQPTYSSDVTNTEDGEDPFVGGHDAVGDLSGELADTAPPSPDVDLTDDDTVSGDHDGAATDAETDVDFETRGDVSVEDDDDGLEQPE